MMRHILRTASKDGFLASTRLRATRLAIPSSWAGGGPLSQSGGLKMGCRLHIG